MKLKVIDRVAPVLNSESYKDNRKYLLGFIVTGLLITFILWAFGFNQTIRKGFGIAVTLELLLIYYWQFKEKPKSVTGKWY